MKKFIILFVIGLCGYVVRANHIVGGELELTHIKDYTYRLSLIQYFDRAQTLNPSPDASVTIFFYSNNGDEFILEETLPQLEETPVKYSNPKCAIGSLSTSRVYYSVVITLDPELFNDPAGYYAVWFRCCRNSGITNIKNSRNTGMIYLLEFPAIVDTVGKPFVNSSPHLFPPLNDYACVNQLYYANFAGVDSDGDSIAYTLVTPLRPAYTNPVVALPPPRPKPYAEVDYTTDFSLDDVILGSPSLAITPQGYLTVNPTNIGLYVFSVMATEYRDKKQIGLVRRDFQMLVLDGCDPPSPPDLNVRLPGQSDYYIDGTVLKYSTADKKCFEVLVVDNSGEEVTLKAVGVNFDEDVSDIFSFTSGKINANGDTLRIEVCLGKCPLVQGAPYIIDLIASDNACPLPQQDVVRMVFDVQPPANNPPYYTKPANYKTEKIQTSQGMSILRELSALDLDKDSLDIYLYGKGFDPNAFGMTLQITEDVRGKKSVDFLWDTNCKKFDFNDIQKFNLAVVLDDFDTCLFNNSDTIFYDLEVDLPLNTNPVLQSELNTNTVEIDIKKSLAFDVSVTDDDGDTISLIGRGINFNLADVGAKFTNKNGEGSLSSRFTWDLSCDNLGIKEDKSYKILFETEDKDYCKEKNTDKLVIEVNVKIPENNKPKFDVGKNHQLTINTPFELNLKAIDADVNDLLTMNLLLANASLPTNSFQFEKTTGKGEVVAPFRWMPDCSMLGSDYSAKVYPVYFLVEDDNCPNVKQDTIVINFEVNEFQVDYNNFLPPNAFSPNNDGINDSYSLSNLNREDANLPNDNCYDQFQSIIIFDRTGFEVYQSRDREFQWTGHNLNPDTYYYMIQYEKNSYKGFISLIR